MQFYWLIMLRFSLLRSSGQAALCQRLNQSLYIHRINSNQSTANQVLIQSAAHQLSAGVLTTANNITRSLGKQLGIPFISKPITGVNTVGARDPLPFRLYEFPM